MAQLKNFIAVGLWVGLSSLHSSSTITPSRHGIAVPGQTLSMVLCSIAMPLSVLFSVLILGTVLSLTGGQSPLSAVGLDVYTWLDSLFYYLYQKSKRFDFQKSKTSGI